MGPRPRKASGTTPATAPPNALPPFPYTSSSSTSTPTAAPSSSAINTMSPAATSTAAAGKTPSSKAPKSKMVVLTLPPKLLANFPHEAPAVKSEASATSSSSSTPANNAPTAEDKKNDAASETPAPAAATPNEADSNAASTPAATNGMLAPPSNASKRKGVPGPKPGMKRTASQLEAGGTPKPRGKPGPKKKARIGENGEVLPTSTNAVPKLGPKANAGAINACLRALDRTGTPCRKWTKKPFTVRSFTGYRFGAGAYATQRQSSESGFAGDVKSDTSSNGEGSGDKPTLESSAVASEKSSADVDTPMQGAVAASSPAAVASAVA